MMFFNKERKRKRAMRRLMDSTGLKRWFTDYSLYKRKLAGHDGKVFVYHEESPTVDYRTIAELRLVDNMYYVLEYVLLTDEQMNTLARKVADIVLKEVEGVHVQEEGYSSAITESATQEGVDSVQVGAQG
jgi:hypothetical protein